MLKITRTLGASRSLVFFYRSKMKKGIHVKSMIKKGIIMKYSRKRVLQVITLSDWAGGQKVLYALVYGLKQNYFEEFDIEVACGPKNGRLIPELEKIGVKIHIVKDLVRDISPLRDAKAFFQLKHIIAKGKFDIVHLHSSKAGFLGRIAAKMAKVPFVLYTVHGWWGIEQFTGFKRDVFILAERFAANFCDKIVFLCSNDLRKAERWKIGQRDQYCIIPNSILPSTVHEKGALRKELGISQDKKIVGNVARLDAQKNPIRFLEVAKKVLSVSNNVVFVWIGSSVVDEKLNKAVEEWLENNKDVKENVYFLGFRKDSEKLVADFDVFLLTSDAEGMPLAVLEAINQGVKVVSTNVGCMEEIVGKDNVGSTVDELARLVLANLEKSGGSNIGNFVNSDYEMFLAEYVKLYRTL